MAVSGGKDSLAVWDILNELGYDAEGFYVGLGIGEYSDVSAEYATRFAHARNLTLHTEDLLRDHGFDVPHGSRAAKRAPCSACGLTKRHLFDEAACRGGYDVIVTGHNLDDEAAVLMGNVLHWHTDYLARQTPMLPAATGSRRRRNRSCDSPSGKPPPIACFAASTISSTSAPWPSATSTSPTRSS